MSEEIISKDELKDYDIMDIEAMDDERLEKSESCRIKATRVYIKSEADKVIAELYERIRKECEAKVNYKTSVCDLSDGLLDAYRDIWHHKYRRCLRIISDIENAIGDAFLVDPEYIDWLNKWHDRWLKIAERFKED